MTEELHIDGSGNIIEFLRSIEQRLNATDKSTNEFQSSVTGTLAKYQKTLNSFSLTNFYNQLQNVSQGLSDLSGPGLDFNSQLMDLSALTGTSGDDLDKLGEKARASAKEFGTNAADSLNNYKVILGRLGPDIAKNQGALDGMEKNVQTLAKTMGNDAAGAVDALTTSVLQYGVDLSKPAEAQKEMSNMMDIMARSAQQGAAEVPQISAALKVSGVAAKMAKVSFAETNAAIQALAQGGKEGSEAGTALRNVLGKMAGEDVLPKEAAEKLKRLGVDMTVVSDKSLSFTDRLRELKKAEGDATIMAQVFGTENEAAARILLQSVDAQDKMTVSVQKGVGASDMAAKVMESQAEKVARMKSAIDDVKIGFFEATGGVTAYLGPINELAMTMTAFAPIVSGAKTAVVALATAKGRAAIASKLAMVSEYAGVIATKAITAAQWLWNAAQEANPIGLVITAVAALAGGIYLLTKAFDSSTASERLNAEVKQRVIDKTSEEQARLMALFSVLKQTNKESAERKKIVSELNEKYPDLLKNYDLEKAGLDEINRAYRDIIRSIEKKAEVEALSEMLTEKTKEVKQLAKDGRGTFEGQEQYLLRLNLAKIEKYKIRDELAAIQVADLKKEMKNQPKEGKSSGETGETPPTGTNPTSPAGYSGGGSSTGKDKTVNGSGNEAMKNIQVRIEQLVGNITISTSNVSESASKIKEMVAEALIGAVRDFETTL